MSKIITTVIIGAGDRGKDTYGNYMLSFPDRFRVIGVVEPNSVRLSKMQLIHELQSNSCFHNWDDFFKSSIKPDIIFITTPDKYHFEPAMKALNKGFHIFLEKPIATTWKECKTLLDTAESNQRILFTGLIFRHTDFFKKIIEVIEADRIGKMISITWRENVSYFHYSHSFIRGNWSNSVESSPMILAKCVHDFDVINLIVKSKPSKISSFGSLLYFNKGNLDFNPPDRCIDGCENAKTCLYYAPRIYMDIVPMLHIARKGGPIHEKIISKLILKFPGLKKFPPFNKVQQYKGWPVRVITDDFTQNGRLNALKNGPYGRCVYKIPEHDVIDHQNVTIEYSNKVTVNLLLHGHSPEEGRTIRIDGVKGSLEGEFMYSGEKIYLNNSYTGTKSLIYKRGLGFGHGGADERIMEDLYNQLESGYSSDYMSNLRKAMESHILAFAAEQSRNEGKIIQLADIE
ncbi:MAG: Gfo/Idh/MocA family oxidoreductase [Candidatus Heimdallarchaeota archaeon]|nr:Gfo/Idh/MocA family oxidoreductase [Candidatus Heimdallarchaeota archaeon]